MSNIHVKICFLFLIVCLFITGPLSAAQQPAQAQGNPPVDSTAANQILDRIAAREQALAARMKNLHPLVETYLQNLDKDPALTFRPIDDKYFLGKLDYNAEERQHTLLQKQSIAKNIFGKITQLYSVKYLPGGFAQMLVISGKLDRNNYDFEFIKREFLGEVRTVVFDVQPKKGSQGTFKGRIWAEDQDYNIVRFNGTYGPTTLTKMFFHFDSWREYMGSGEWLPAYVYTEESDAGYLMGARKLRFKGQTRLWGYNVGNRVPKMN
jgi:hypothetical protein